MPASRLGYTWHYWAETKIKRLPEAVPLSVFRVFRGDLVDSLICWLAPEPRLQSLSLDPLEKTNKNGELQDERFESAASG